MSNEMNIFMANEEAAKIGNPESFRFIDRDEIASEKITAPRYSYWKSVFRVFFRKKSNIVMLAILAIVILVLTIGMLVIDKFFG